MAYDYDLTLTDTGVESGTTNINSLVFDVTESGSPVGDLNESDFNITDSSGSAIAHSVVQGSANAWTVELTSAIANTERIFVQIITDDATAKKSQKILIDFLQNISGANVDIDFVLPDDSGNFNYDFDLHNVSGFNAEGFDTTQANISALEISSNKPTNDASSITLKSGKYYLTYFSGDTITLEVEVKDGDGFVDGNYELSIKSTEA